MWVYVFLHLDHVLVEKQRLLQHHRLFGSDALNTHTQYYNT